MGFMSGLSFLLVVHCCLHFEFGYCVCPQGYTCGTIPGPTWDSEFSDPNDNPNDIRLGEIRVRVLGKSGRMVVRRYHCPRDTESIPDDHLKIRCKQTVPVTLKFLGIIERDINGVEVGRDRFTRRNDNNIYDSFQSQLFVFSGAQDDVLVPNSNVMATSISFTTDFLQAGSTMTVTIYLIKQDGYIISDDETLELEEGMLKVTVKLEGWQFCGCSGEGIGHFLDFSMSVRSGGQVRQPSSLDGCCGTGTTDQHWTLGDDGCAAMALSKKVLVDGVWQDLPTGYPQHNVVNDTSVFVFRLPKFQQSLIYDPTATASDQVELSAIKIG